MLGVCKALVNRITQTDQSVRRLQGISNRISQTDQGVRHLQGTSKRNNPN